MTPQVLIIAKEPRPGLVKTRLTPPCTPAQAAALAAAALADTMNTVRNVAASRRVLVFEGRPPADRRSFHVIAQRGNDLAERLANAFADAGTPAILIGMDCPQMSRGLLAEALNTLASPTCDAVLGPALDGGYWAIGLKASDRRVFSEIPMSAPQTCAMQLARLRSLGLRVGLLQVLRDVDRYADARSVALQIPTSNFGVAVAGVERELVVT
jgi:uncharacterized protein